MRVRVWEGGRERGRQKEKGIFVAVWESASANFECDWMWR